MSENSNAASKGLIVVIVVVALFALCFVGSIVAAIAIPAFTRYIKVSKATEAETNVRRIAREAKAQFESSADCQFPPSAGPLPAIIDCCEESCIRTGEQMSAPGWKAVGFDTAEAHRFQYVTVSEPGRYDLTVPKMARYTVGASADFDCDGQASVYSLQVIGSRDAAGKCVATLGELSIENELE